MDKKISELNEMIQAKNSDLLAIVDSASPVETKKIRSENFRDFLVPVSMTEVTGLQESLDGKINQNSIIDGGGY